MQIYFGLHTTTETTVSQLLKDKGINLLRAAPGQINLVGLNRIPQAGFDQYIANLPAFMYATEVGKRRAIYGTGHPVQVKFSNCLPISLPPVFMVQGKGNTPSKMLSSLKYTEYMTKKDKTSYLVDFDPGMLKHVADKTVFSEEYAPAQAVRFCDIPHMVMILRIFSSFIRTHEYPAFVDDSHEAMFEYKKKRPLYSIPTKEDGRPDKLLKISENGQSGEGYGFWNKDTFKNDEAKKETPHAIELFVAKPTSVATPWGTTQFIPQTLGINMPYIAELSRMDKETVPRVIERYFLRALHQDTEKCLSSFSSLVAAWKTSICQTHWGQCISHLARTIEIGLPAQGRIFPIIDGNQYCGVYLSGGGMSVAQGKELIRPDPYDKNFKEISCFGESRLTRQRLIDWVVDKIVDDSSASAITKASGISVRAISEFFANENDFHPSEEERATIIGIVSRISFGIPFFPVNPDKLNWFMNMLVVDEPIPLEVPMYAGDLFVTDRLSLILSAFGPKPPSPMLPNVKPMKITEKLPDKFNGIIGLRNVDLDMARSDWIEAWESGEIRNGPTNLSARYEHGVLNGLPAKEGFFKDMWATMEWYKANKGKVVIEVSGTIEGGDDFVKINVGDDAFDFGGFV